MKKLNYLLGSIVSGVFAFGFAFSASAITWSVEDHPSLTSPGGYPWNMSKDGDGHIYAAGSDGTSGVTRKSDTSGSNWTTVDTFNYSTTGNTWFGPTTASGSTIYIGGQGQDSSNNWHWIIRKSTDEGSTWSTVEDWTVPTGNDYSEIRSLGMDSSGHVYVAGGYGSSTALTDYWQVLGSSDSGSTWSSLDNVTGSGGTGAFAAGLGVDSGGNVYVVGTIGQATVSTTCSGELDYQVTRKSTDHGSTWTSYDNFLTSGQCWDFPVMVHIDSSGNLYTPGTEGTDANNRSSYIRKSTDGGATWSNIDTFTLTGNTDTEAYVVRTDASGNIFEAGHAKDSNGIQNWFVREYTGGVWSIVDQYTGSDSVGARADDMIFDNAGDLIVGGLEKGSTTGTTGWVVRKGTF